MRRLVLPLVVALAGVGLGSGAARAESTCGTVLDVCMDFTLVESGGGWGLLTDWVSSRSGLLRSGARSYGAWSHAPGVGIGHEIGVRAHGSPGLRRPEPVQRGKGSPEDWGETLTGGLVSGTRVITVTFPTSGMVAGNRTRYSGRGGESSGSPGGEGGVGGAPPGVGPVSATTPVPASTTTPEPASMVLLAAGLGGLALPVLRRRRKRFEV